jgi:hypothetical protein
MSRKLGSSLSPVSELVRVAQDPKALNPSVVHGDGNDSEGLPAAADNQPMLVKARQLASLAITYQRDGGRQWVEKTYELYRGGAQVVLDDAVAHGKIETLAGQEHRFSVRCSC